jgi:hypothetical protein
MPKKLKVEKEESMKEEEVFFECGSTSDDEIWKVTKSFQLIIKAGPPVPMPVGALVRLRPDSARELFPFHVLPANLQDPGKYEAIEKFKVVDINGYWEFIGKGDVLELTLAEAIPLIRKFQVKPMKGGGEKK